MADDIEDIGQTLRALATSHRTPKQLLKATMLRHPKASKKLVARAAFWAMIDAAPSDPDQAVRLQDLGLQTRNSDS